MNEKSITLLNKAVAEELTAVNQYMYFHFHCNDQGLNLLAELFKRTAIAEMGHVEKISERALALKGDINMNINLVIRNTKSVNEMLRIARAMEEDGMKQYKNSADECSSCSDMLSKKLFEELKADEEKHFNQFDKELKSIEERDKTLSGTSIDV